MIDLHCHSHFSDGTHAVDELLSMAIDNGVSYLALTDHDTVAGISPIMTAAEALTGQPVKIIPGIEISAAWKKHLIHILGLNLKYPDRLGALIEQQGALRYQRAIEIAERLEGLSLENVFEKVSAIAGQGSIGRPHFARLLLEEGHVKDMQAAFKKYLGRGKPAYVPTAWVSIEEAVNAIHDAGGWAVIAHPLHYNLTRTALMNLTMHFKALGGDGIEVVSGEMRPKEIKEVAGLCERFELLASTGSDFHGKGISRTGLGQQQPLPEHCRPIWAVWDFFEGNL